MLDHALAYARRGWKVFPLKARGKTPLTTDGFQSATTDEAQIRAWWARWPDANVGIATGAGLVVLDFDQKSGGLETLAGLELPPTLEVNTGGGGKHFYFRGESRNRAGLKPGMDVRGDGGYVVAPPSIHESGRPYTFVNVDCGLAVAPAGLLKKPEPTHVPRPTTTPAVRGRLSRATMDFLVNGAPPGQWNDTLFRAAKNAYEQGWAEEDFIERAERIEGYLDESSLRTIRSGFSNEPLLPVNGSQALVDFVRRATAFQNMADPSETSVIDLSNGDTMDISPIVIEQVLGRAEFANYKRTNIRHAAFEYNPRSGAPTRANALGIEVFNTYQPPEWLKAAYYSRNKPTLVPQIPSLYEGFFRHLTGNHAESYQYLLDWLATSMTGRNLTLLTAIGEQGVGKGTLGQILESLHGRTNFAKVRDQIFKAHFNGPLANKTLVYVDEADLKTKEAQDRMKDVVNPFIEIERKGFDAITVQNWASFYLSSNSMDAVRIEAGDRRFSIIQLTDEKLIATPFRDRVEELTAPESVAELAGYLLGHQVTNDMMRPFRSARYEQVKEASLFEWEEFVLYEWAIGATGRVPLKKVQDALVMGCGLRAAPGRAKLEQLAKRYPERLRFHRSEHGQCTVESLVSEAAKPAAKWPTIN